MSNETILDERLPDTASTEAVGARLAAGVRGGMVITLSGELGAGKTTLVRGLLHALGVEGRVKSPTFALVEVYELSNLYCYHFDFYRMENPAEMDGAGFRECFRDDALCLVEWPERAGPALPPADVEVLLAYEDAGRRIRLTARTPAGAACLARYEESRRRA
jgi:tRNA threonylcarbamoyladenosine biosynthesis protein TsaE